MSNSRSAPRPVECAVPHRDVIVATKGTNTSCDLGCLLPPRDAPVADLTEALWNVAIARDRGLR